MTETIYILLPTHNRKAAVQQFFRCLAAQSYPHYHLVLIDDGCTDGTSDLARQSVSPDKLTILRGRGNWWWSGSLEQATQWLKKKHISQDAAVLIMNDDTEFGEHFLQNGAGVLKKNEHSLVHAENYCRDSKAKLPIGLKIDWKNYRMTLSDDPETLDCFFARGLFLRAADLMQIGGFHPRLLPHYFADAEYTQRARRKGMRFVTDPSVHLSLNQKTTGIHSAERPKPTQSLKLVFSKKYLFNPLYLTTFICLACPRRYAGLNICRVWAKFFAQGLGALSKRPLV